MRAKVWVPASAGMTTEILVSSRIRIQNHSCHCENDPANAGKDVAISGNYFEIASSSRLGGIPRNDKEKPRPVLKYKTGIYFISNTSFTASARVSGA